tara:strand:+ start:3754 stop:5100 length:1347 start_codon:yes stop_codon:yes gene_type:complete
MKNVVTQYLELLRQNIDRASLVSIATKLKIAGYSNKFRRPYVKKNELKEIILKELKKRSIRKSSSVSDFRSKLRGGKRKRSRSESSNVSSFKSSPFSPIHYKVESANTLRLPKVQRLIAIGDIHGDLRAIIRALKVAGVIPLHIPENNNKIDVKNVPWIGKNTVVVQLGDQIDRARPTSWCNDCVDEEIPDDEGSDLKIMNLMDNLHLKAQQNGGAVISILGNHELMNAKGDFRYVSLKEFEEFGLVLSGNETDDDDKTVPFGYKERMSVFVPGGIMAKRMAYTRFCVVQVGSWIFVHGGITPKIALKYSIDHLNYITKEWLKGNHTQKIVNAFDDIFENDDNDMSPYWTRLFSEYEDWNEDRMKYLFNTTLKILNSKNKGVPIKGMIVGHSPQYMWDRKINSSFNNRLWRVDVGMSRAFGPDHEQREYRKVQVLEIKNDNQFTILTE